MNKHFWLCICSFENGIDTFTNYCSYVLQICVFGHFFVFSPRRLMLSKANVSSKSIHSHTKFKGWECNHNITSSSINPFAWFLYEYFCRQFERKENVPKIERLTPTEMLYAKFLCCEMSKLTVFLLLNVVLHNCIVCPIKRIYFFCVGSIAFFHSISFKCSPVFCLSFLLNYLHLQKLISPVWNIISLKNEFDFTITYRK